MTTPFKEYVLELAAANKALDDAVHAALEQHALAADAALAKYDTTRVTDPSRDSESRDTQ